MDPYRHGTSDRYGAKHDLSLLAAFLLPLLLFGAILAALTVDTLWTPPDLPSMFAGEKPVSSMFRNNGNGTGPAGAGGGVAVPTATTEATATPEPATPTPEPEATPTSAPVIQQPDHYVVGNTGGVGVWLRRTPRMNDYLITWPDNTRMQTIGPDVEAEGRVWRNVMDPRGNRGFVPAEWLIAVEE
jgi:hypothetical protein